MPKTSSKTKVKGSKEAAAAFQRQAKLLHDQAAARKRSLGELGKQLDNAKSRNKDTRRSTIADLLGGFRTSSEGYDRSEKDNEGNLGITAASSRLNRAREGANAMAEVANLGGGLTDRIKAMAASIRNMKGNLDGGANDYASAITQINNSLGDLNTSTTTNINNALREENANDASAFAEWSAGQQQGYADLVDLYGQLGAAHEQAADALADKKSSVKGKTNTKGTKSSTTQTDDIKYGKKGKKELGYAKKAFGYSAANANKLADQMGAIFTDKAKTIDEMNAEEADPMMHFARAQLKKNQSNLGDLSNAGTLRKLSDAEGSTLRKKLIA